MKLITLTTIVLFISTTKAISQEKSIAASKDSLVLEFTKRGMSKEAATIHINAELKFLNTVSTPLLKNQPLVNSVTNTYENISSICSNFSSWSEQQYTNHLTGGSPFLPLGPFSIIPTNLIANTSFFQNTVNLPFYCSTDPAGQLVKLDDCVTPPLQTNTATGVLLSCDPVVYGDQIPNTGRVIRKGFFVNIQNCVLSYQYACVNGGCSGFFQARVLNQSNNLIYSHSCAGHPTPVTNCPGLSDPLINGNAQAPWNPGMNKFHVETIDLSQYYNQNITIEFINAPCFSGQHLHYTLLATPCVCQVCTTGANITVNTTSTPAYCSGSNGSITANPSGGTAPYTYLWANGATTQTISNLPPGISIGVTVTDASGCKSTMVMATVAAIPNPVLSLITSPESCGNNNGTISATTTGGLPGYEYKINNGAFQTSALFNNLAQGSYSVTVKDANGCTATKTVTILASDSQIVVDGQTQDPVCNGGNTGKIEVLIPAAGNAPYFYSIDGVNFQTSNSFNSLSAGTYTITVKDANGCTGTKQFAITQPAPIHLSETHTNSTCGRPNGEIDITVSGGTSPYTYTWNEGTTTEDISQLTPGNYMITVTDANGCTATKNITIISNGSFVSLSETHTNTTCGNNNGSIQLSVSGGTSPYTFSWGHGASGSSLTGLASGNYDAWVTDANGCRSQNITVNISASSKPGVTATHVRPVCTANNGSIDITVTGGVAPYTYVWNNGSGLEDPINLSPGNYTVIVTDAAGCSASKSVVLKPIKKTISVSVAAFTNEICSNQKGSITPAYSGGTVPYNVTWKKNGNPFTPPLSGWLAAGTYTITVTDANGCSGTVTKVIQNINQTISIAEATTSNVLCNTTNTGQIAFGFTPTGGTAPYSYNWSLNGTPLSNTTSSMNNLTAGNYQITIIDANSCSITKNYTISNEPCPPSCCVGGQWTSKYIGWSNTHNVFAGMSKPVIQELQKTGITAEEIENPDAKPKQVNSTKAAKTTIQKSKTGIGSQIGPLPDKINITNCNTTYQLSQNGKYTLNADYQCGGTQNNCPKQVKVTIQGPPGCTFNGTYNVPYTQTFVQDGNYTITYSAYCGTEVCSTCSFTVVIEKNCCLNGKWVAANYQTVTKTGGVIATTLPAPLPLTITSPIPVFSANQSVNISGLNYLCASGCSATYKVVKRNIVSGVQTTTILPASTTSFSVTPLNDKQLIRVFPMCGTQQCPGMLLFYVTCSDNSCTSQGAGAAIINTKGLNKAGN